MTIEPDRILHPLRTPTSPADVRSITADVRSITAHSIDHQARSIATSTSELADVVAKPG
jgi:hypothetical protein